MAKIAVEPEVLVMAVRWAITSRASSYYLLDSITQVWGELSGETRRQIRKIVWDELDNIDVGDQDHVEIWREILGLEVN